MALTDKMKFEFYDLLSNTKNPEQISDHLNNPFDQDLFVVDYISPIKNFKNLKIVQMEKFDDKRIIFYNSDDGSVIGIFDQEDNIIYQVNFHNTNGKNEKLLNFINVQINTNNGLIYGLCEENDKTNFFVFNNIITRINFETKPEDIENQLFYTVLFNVEDEKTTDDGDNDVKIGNNLFKDIRTNSELIYGYSIDVQKNLTFSFIIQNTIDKSLQFIQFTTEIGQRNAQEADWNYNEPVSLSQGAKTQSTFDGLSIANILTGEKNISNTQKSLGSIAVSTQKDASSSVIIPFERNVKTSNVLKYPSRTRDGLFSKKNNNSVRAQVSESTRIANDDNFFNSWVNEIKNVINSDPTSINYYGTIYIKSKYSDGSVSQINLSKTQIDKIIKAETNYLIIERYYIYEAMNDDRSAYDPSLKIKISFGVLSDRSWAIRNSYTKDVPIGRFNVSLNRKQTIFRGTQTQNISFFTGNIRVSSSQINVEISANFTIQGTRKQKSLSSNTTSQIVIETSEDSDNLIYKIVQQENNSFGATKPVFLSPEKFYIPLKSRDTNQFYIAEFTGETNVQTQNITRFYNDVSLNDYAGNDEYLANLILPQSITSVVINSNIISTSRYSLTGNEISISSVKKNDQIIIEYISEMGQPLNINIDKSTNGENLLIKSVSDFEELGTLSRTIVGIGDDSFEGTQNNIFGFNLYRSKVNVDYDKIAETIIPDSNTKMKHIVVERQKNIIFLEGFNEDYTKVYKWKQIYPDSFSPYTYDPYIDLNKLFYIERFNSTIDEKNNPVFDREFLDRAFSNGTILANTIAESSDFNNPKNNIQTIYGATNVELFEFNKNIEKNNTENLSINFQLTTDVFDNVNGNVKNNDDVKRMISELFTNKNTDIANSFYIDKIRINYLDGSSFTNPSNEFIENMGDYVQFSISLVEVKAKKLSKIDLILSNNKTLTTINLKDKCKGVVINVKVKIYLEDNEDQKKGGENN